MIGHANKARLRGRRDGAAAAEFAMMLPMLLAMMFGVVQLGFAGFTHSSMLTSARTGARQIAFGANQASALASVRAQLPGYIRSAATINVTENASGMARVQVSVPGAAASLIPFLPMPTTISAEITMPRVADR
jgi:Flp pilus assembly protein TadG